MNSQSTRNQKILEHLKKIQIVCEFLVLSKVKQNHEAVPQMFMAIEAFKFYFKSVALSQSKGILYQHVPQPQQLNELRQQPQEGEQKSTSDEQSHRQTKIEEEKQFPRQDAIIINAFPRQKKNQRQCFRPKTENEFKNKNQGKNRKSTQQFRQYFGELLRILRPFISITCIRIFGIESYKSYFISLILDLFIALFLQKAPSKCSQAQKKQMKARRCDILLRYLFRKPFFSLIIQHLIRPLLSKMIDPSRMLSKFLLSILQMQSSISLTI